MKEANIVSQLSLVEAMSKGRQSQLDAISVAISAYRSDKNNRQSKIFTFVAVYMQFLAQWLEKEVARELMTIQSELKQLHTFPSEEQIDYRLAHVLGILEGLNTLGIVSHELISRSQSALHKATFLGLINAEIPGLKAYGDKKNDEIYLASQEASDNSRLTMVSLVRMAKTCALKHYQQCEMDEERVDLALSPIASATTARVIADILNQLASVCTQPFDEKRIFDNDPSFNAVTDETTIARALAAGAAADIILTYVRRGDRFGVLLLN